MCSFSFEHNIRACSLQFNGLSSTLQNHFNDLIKCHCVNLERQVCWWERDIKPFEMCIVHQWQVFHMDIWEIRVVSVFNVDAREETDTQSSLIGFRSLLEALCIRNRNVRHELLMGILKLFFKFPFFFRPDSWPWPSLMGLCHRTHWTPQSL